MKNLSGKQWALTVSVSAVVILSGFFIWNAVNRADGQVSSSASGSSVSASGILSDIEQESFDSGLGSSSGISAGLSAGSSIAASQVEDALISLIAGKAPADTLEEELKAFDAIDFSNRLFRPTFDTKVDLFVATYSARPSVLPSTAIIAKRPGSSAASTYSSTGFIDSTASPVRWFAFTKEASITAAKYVWQVGIAPFPGDEALPLSPPGLIVSGEVAADAADFSIDFSNVVSKKTLAFSGSAVYRILPLDNLEFGTPGIRRPYYVRLLPLDKNGKLIGDGGKGITVVYGKPKSTVATRGTMVIKFGLRSPINSGRPTFSGEFPNSFNEYYERFIDSQNKDRSYYFLPVKGPSEAITYVLQVSNAPMPANAWETVPGLVYERRLHKGTVEFDNLSEQNSIKVDFAAFAPADNLLKANERIPYFVRVVALLPGKESGVVATMFSKEVTVTYGRPEASGIKIYDTVSLDAQLPVVNSYSYTPIRWEAANWQYHYVVIRQPSEKEIFPGFLGSNDPYGPYAVGVKLDFTPQPDDSSWWEDALNAVSDFFSDLTGFLGDIVNWVSKSYADLKSGLISFVAKNLTYFTPGLRSLVEDALTGLVDYGLASIGIPPSLPNFDSLANLGVDYLATVALESAGVPASEYVADGVTDIAKGISDGMAASTNTASANPFSWNFIKLDPDSLFRPAYVLIEITNPYSVPTAPGYITGSNQFVIDSTKVPLTPTEDWLLTHFSGNVYYQTFKAVSGQRIPSLAPGQTLVIPIFLEEPIGDTFWTNGPKITDDSFKAMYYNLGDFDFSFTLNYDLPSASDKAKELGLPADAIYKYQATGTTITFKTHPRKAFAGK